MEEETTTATQSELQKKRPLLEVDNINVFYGDVQVLWDVSFSVEEGKIISLIGSNGAGKTTTLKTVSGIVRPRAGTVTFDGGVLNKMSTTKIVDSGVVYVPEGRGIFPDMSVRENLDMGSYSRRARRQHNQLIKKVYSLFPLLEERSSQRAGTLSGGESQMLAVGRGIMQFPRMLMLDEPSAGVAPIIVDNIFRAIKKLRDEDRLTILLVEQDAGRSLAISDNAYVLENGRMKLSGPGQDLLDNQYVREAYLGM